MANAFQDLYANERDLRTTERVLSEHRLRKWQIATAAASVTAAMLGLALVFRGVKRPAIGAPRAPGET